MVRFERLFHHKYESDVLSLVSSGGIEGQLGVGFAAALADASAVNCE
jgi:hypothetical protein